MTTTNDKETAQEMLERSTVKAKRRNATAVKAIVIPMNKRSIKSGDSAFDQAGSSATQEVRKAYTQGNVEPGATAQPKEDPWISTVNSGQVIEPPFDLLTLSMLWEQNTEMISCIEAMEVNCDSFGHRFVPRIHVNDKTPKDVAEAINAERVLLENFFEYASIDDSFTELRRKRRKNLEGTGNAFWEVVRAADNTLQGFEHVPSYLCRISVAEADPVEVDVPIAEMQADGSVKVKKQRAWKRFRKVAMQRTGSRLGSTSTLSSEVVWFKEFGDPRSYDRKTGFLLSEEEAKAKPRTDLANEIIHFKLYTDRSPYGLPRYIGNLLNIFGARSAEEINFITFQNNNVPSMMILVSNGALTQESIDRLNEFAQERLAGSDNYSKFLVIEAEGQSAGTDLSEDSGTAKISTEPLTQVQHTDALFVNYRKASKEEIRGVWRISPIFLGHAEDHTYSNAEQSRKLTDEQVFAPERDRFDDFVNRKILPALGVVYHRFRSNTPITTDNTELVNIMNNSEKTGGMTPRISRQVIEQILNRDLPSFPEGFPQDIPFSLLMAFAVKNLADPTQPGQQVTAVKDATPPPLPLKVTDPHALVSSLMEMSRGLEAGWKHLMPPEAAPATPKLPDDGKR